MWKYYHTQNKHIHGKGKNPHVCGSDALMCADRSRKSVQLGRSRSPGRVGPLSDAGEDGWVRLR